MQFTLAGRFHEGMQDADFWGDDSGLRVMFMSAFHKAAEGRLEASTRYHIEGSDAENKENDSECIDIYVHEITREIVMEVLGLLSGCKPQEITIVEAGLM